MADLKACRYCGGEAKESLLTVRCGSCHAHTENFTGRGGEYQREQMMAEAAWNRGEYAPHPFTRAIAEKIMTEAGWCATNGQRDTARGVPEGWTIEARENGDILIQSPMGDGAGVWHDDDSLLAEVVRQLCRDLLAAAPTPPDGDAERERRDAERYRHVRAHGLPKQCAAGFYYRDGVFYPTEDAAIDAAVAASKGEKG